MTVIHVGSMNQTKIQAAANVLTKSSLFSGASVLGVEVEIEEFGHPKTIDETIQGAKDRARAAHLGSDLSVGIEAGLIKAPGTKTGYLETTVCALYDGQNYSIGMGPAFEWPLHVQQLILDGLDGSQAFKKAGLTVEEKLGKSEGAIYVLSKGEVNRTHLNEEAIAMALVQFENPQLY